jgi:hypothetical protein
LLAKVVNDNACNLDELSVFEFFASKLAPTGEGWQKQNSPALMHRRMMGTDTPTPGCKRSPGFLARVV